VNEIILLVLEECMCRKESARKDVATRNGTIRRKEGGSSLHRRISKMEYFMFIQMRSKKMNTALEGKK